MMVDPHSVLASVERKHCKLVPTLYYKLKVKPDVHANFCHNIAILIDSLIQASWNLCEQVATFNLLLKYNTFLLILYNKMKTRAWQLARANSNNLKVATCLYRFQLA